MSSSSDSEIESLKVKVAALEAELAELKTSLKGVRKRTKRLVSIVDPNKARGKAKAKAAKS